jgi:DNA adenine methylase
MGGKGKICRKLLQYIPPHRTYVEVFGGGANLLFVKPPSPVEVYNDIDHSLVDFFRVLSSPELFEKFYRRVAVLPYSRTLYKECLETWHLQEDIIERTIRWYIVARQSFGGRFGSGWGYSVKESAGGMARAVSGWLSTLEMLPEIHRRLMKVQIECLDFRDAIKIYDTEETFFYLDPPYHPETRKSDKGYRYELEVEEYTEMVEILLRIKGKCMLSGYFHEVFTPLEEAGWKRIEIDTACLLGAGVNGKVEYRRLESVWMNYTIQEVLFD